jgi:hypothetical protein
MAEAAFGGALAQAAATADSRARHTRAIEARAWSRIVEILSGYGMRKADGVRSFE